jgi:DNA gyrase subunit B
MRRADTRRILSDQARAQWADDRYKAFMTAKWREFYAGNEAYREENRERLNRAQREYWADQDHRTEQAGRTRAHFANVPGARAALSSLARAQWNDQALVEWRRMKTREQWTPEFRARRLAALDRTYYRKTIGALQAFRTDEGVDLEGYAAHRSATGDKSLLRFDRFCERYFGGDAACAVDAVTHHNHQVVSVERLDERIDVYDIEVPNTHNFALASGVFVHNSAKQGRDRRFQAILPIKGKILNVEKARLDKMLGNEEIRTLITAIGTGIGAAASEGGEFDVTKARYGKIIIMTDADIDGAHIRTLLLTFFYRHMRPLIEAGKMYIAQPPLYRVKKGKTERYAFSDKEKDRLVREMGGAAAAAEESAQPGLFDAAGGVGAGDRAVRRGGAAGAGAGADGGGRGRGAGDGMRGITIQRYKGLGEMNPEQLWKTTMDPETRTILKVDIEDAAAADHIFSILMGEKVEPRRDFIEKNAASVRNLDV